MMKAADALSHLLYSFMLSEADIARLTMTLPAKYSSDKSSYYVSFAALSERCNKMFHFSRL